MSTNEEQAIVIKNVRKIQQLSYSVPQFSKRTSICKNKIYAAFKDGSLIGRKIGDRTIILHEEGLAWLKSLPIYIPGGPIRGRKKEVEGKVGGEKPSSLPAAGATENEG